MLAKGQMVVAFKQWTCAFFTNAPLIMPYNVLTVVGGLGGLGGFFHSSPQAPQICVS